MRWPVGEQVVGFLLERGRLERVGLDGIAPACEALLERATKRLATARAAEAGEDWEGAFANAYDVYRMAADCLLLRQGLRSTGGEGSHVAVEDAVSAQFADRIAGFSKVASSGSVRAVTPLSTSTRAARRRPTTTLAGHSISPRASS